MYYNKDNYINKVIILYPHDTHKKYGIILDVDDLGWTINICKYKTDYYSYNPDNIMFISHSKPFTFIFSDKESCAVSSS